ncbi:hypothetical protein HHI36_016056 [Cryptolaemus montrouzieri]|uniref:Uncharacterized protein n=1 Tax=Cryptolaemus montrouzieri TaxID=559131 RepID=A0ABD2N893_9CUCU
MVLQEESKIKAYVPYIHFHLSKVGLENHLQDILEFVRSKIPNISVKCEELKVKSGEYRSFKISVLANYSSQLLKNTFWPQLLVVKKFVKQNFQKLITQDANT